MVDDEGTAGTEASFFIYALRDPRDRAIRYVGMTTDPKRRERQHVWNMQIRNKAKLDWVLELRGLGLRPQFEVLERTDVHQWRQSERRWIALLRDECGQTLLNLRAGGETFAPKTREQIEWLRIINLGKKVGIRTRQRMTESQTVRWARTSEAEREAFRETMKEAAKKRVAANPELQREQAAHARAVKAQQPKKPISDAHRAQLRAALAARWARTSPEQRSEIGRKMIAVRKNNRGRAGNAEFCRDRRLLRMVAWG